jgi:hypothetical protein
MIKYIGWILPLMIIATWGAVAYYSYYGVDGVRIGFYVLLVVSLVLGTISLTKSGRGNARSGENPTLYLLVTVYERLVLLALALGLILSFANSFTQTDFFPVWFVQAEVGASALCLAITNSVLYFGRRYVGLQVKPGPLRVLFGKRRTR